MPCWGGGRESAIEDLRLQNVEAISVGRLSPGTYLDRRPAGAELYLDGEALTLRQFVCYLLGYMSFLGIVTLVASVAAPLVHDAILKAIGSGHLYAFVLNSGTAILFLLLSALLVTVLWSLYFLTEVVNAKSRYDGAPPPP